MSVLIVQLSDLHAKSGKEKVFEIADAIYKAIASEINDDTEACVIIFNGDAAYGGIKEQFEHVAAFIRHVRESIQAQFGSIKVVVLTVPGNHDCDLTSEDSEARNTLRKTLAGKMPASSVSRILLEAQANYFEFANAIGEPGTAFDANSPYFRHFDISLSDGLLRFDLLNSAWTSVIHETDDLKYPLEAFKPPSKPEAQYAIAVLHHPPHWFLMPGVRRELRELLESHSDVILTGHEHENEASRRKVLDGGEVAYTEGGVLCDPDRPDLITFNVIRIDFKNDKQLIKRFRFSKDHFATDGEAEVSSLLSNRFRKDREFRLSLDFDEWLDDFEDPLSHPREDDLRLSHLFSYPDLRRVTDVSDKPGVGKQKAERVDVIKSGKVGAEILGQRRAFVTGGDKSGKTTILKQLFLELRRHDKVPVFIKGGEISRTGNPDQLRKQIAAAIKKQYQFLKPEAFEQLDQDKKVFIVDDFQNAPVDSKAKERILSYVTDHFGSSILAASNDFFIELIGNHNGVEVNSILQYQRYEIADFGKQRFEELAMRWTSLGRKDEDQTLVKTSALDLCDKVHTLIAVAGLPHTPWLLLIILEQNESPDATIAAKNGDIGHLYNAVITVKLAQSKFTRFNLTGKFTYLSELAYEFYKTNRAVMREQELHDFHSAYMDRFDFTLDYEQVRDDLVETRMLRMDGDEIAFRHKFVFAFFVAYWMSRNIHKSEAQQLVSQLCARLDHDISANVLVFLSHLTDNPIVLSEMKKAAAELLKSSKKATMSDDLAPLNKLSMVRPVFALPATPPEVNRRLLQEAEDERSAKHREVTEQDGRLVQPLPPAEEKPEIIHKSVRELRAALRTIRILGQVLRNKALATEGADKIALMEELLDLDRRVLGYLYGFIEYLDVMVVFLRKRLMELMVAAKKREMRQKLGVEEDAPDAEAKTKMGRTELRQLWSDAGVLAKKYWFDLYSLASYGAIRHAASAIGSRELDTTLSKIRAKGDSIPLRLIDLAVRMNRRGPNIPADEFVKCHQDLGKAHNRVAQVVLDAMGWERVVLFDTAPSQAQAICGAMGIKVPPVAYDESRKKFAVAKK